MSLFRFAQIGDLAFGPGNILAPQPRGLYRHARTLDVTGVPWFEDDAFSEVEDPLSWFTIATELQELPDLAAAQTRSWVSNRLRCAAFGSSRVLRAVCH